MSVLLLGDTDDNRMLHCHNRAKRCFFVCLFVCFEWLENGLKINLYNCLNGSIFNVVFCLKCYSVLMNVCLIQQLSV